MGAACRLTFIKQAVKRQITGLYGFIMPAMQDHSPGLRAEVGEGRCASSREAGSMLAGQPVLVEVCCPNGCHHVRVCSG